MKPQMTNEERPCIKPLLAIYESDVAASVITHTIEYSEDRMILVVNGRPVILQDECIDATRTKVTFIKHETTDDE